jgi:glycosyltransferase involved in cell wall biosynthesis
MKISIVTVVWNAVEGIARTIDSVSQQDYDNIEYIVIDGLSTDGTLDVIEQKKANIDHFLSEPDEGLYDAMNKGKSMATGDYVLFMNAGDVFLNINAISTMVSFMGDSPKLYYGNTIVFFGQRRSRAPHIHHQALFYPKCYYKTEDYNHKKYKIVAESDYTHRAVGQLAQQYCEVDLILSKLEGLRIHSYSTIRGTLKIYNEVQANMREHGKLIPILHRITYPLKCLTKYFAFKLGGLPLAANIVLSKAKAVRD